MKCQSPVPSLQSSVHNLQSPVFASDSESESEPQSVSKLDTLRRSWHIIPSVYGLIAANADAKRSLLSLIIQPGTRMSTQLILVHKPIGFGALLVIQWNGHEATSRYVAQNE